MYYQFLYIPTLIDYTCYNITDVCQQASTQAKRCMFVQGWCACDSDDSTIV